MFKIPKLFILFSFFMLAETGFSQEEKIATFYGLPADCGDRGPHVECTWPTVLSAGALKSFVQEGQSVRIRFGSNAAATSMTEYDIYCGSTHLIRYQVTNGRIFDYYIPSAAVANTCGDASMSVIGRWYGSASSIQGIADSEIVVTTHASVPTTSIPSANSLNARCTNGLLIGSDSATTITKENAGPCRTKVTKSWTSCRLVNGDLTVIPGSTVDYVEDHGGRCGNLN